jgi:hypothetical protein
MTHPKNTGVAKARQANLIVRELPDEVLVYDLNSYKAHCLNETAAFVWNHCDGKTSAVELAALMHEEYGQPVDDGVVWLALKQLSRADLLEETIAPNADAARASRRAVLRRLGAAAALTPLVISVIAPSASAGTSIPPECQACVKRINGVGSCPALCVTTPFLGACYDNSGCGAGQQLTAAGTVTCEFCLSGQVPGTSPPPTGGGYTVSWSAPD